MLLTKSDVCVILAYLGKTHLVFYYLISGLNFPFLELLDCQLSKDEFRSC